MSGELVCGLTEHKHGEACALGDCNRAEHTHTASCYRTR